MKKRIETSIGKHWGLLFLGALMTQFTWGQEKLAVDDWHLSDHDTGINLEQAYALLKHRVSEKVIVAVIDTGVDYLHEDLRSNIWVNTDEIPNNLIDDDHNGFVDDIHGWNFIGFPNGDNVESETLIETRIVGAGKKYPGSQEMFDAATRAYHMHKRATVDKKEEYEKYLAEMEDMKSAMDASLQTLEELTTGSTSHIVDMLYTAHRDGKDIAFVENQIKEIIVYYTKALEYYYNPTFNSRHIVGDDIYNKDQRFYGNNDVAGPNPTHGTHIAGIIGAMRNNGKGMDGITEHVELMVLRAVPDGDERDKDVANAILYAVNNGASIINLSFGKDFSWEKDWVDEAVRYAKRKDVLIVHAAGNAARKLDGNNNFPNKYFESGNLFGPTEAENWIEVGASTPNFDETFVAKFSNYGQEQVDLVAPGANIYSTTPENSYTRLSGTSMAAPMVTGLAALLKSYFPQFSPKELKEIILDSAKPIYLTVYKPGGTQKVKMKSLFGTGGLLDCGQAVKMALEKSERD